MENITSCPNAPNARIRSFDINTMLDKWDEYRQARLKTKDTSRAAKAKRNDGKHTVGKRMLCIKSRSRDNICEAHINMPPDLIKDDDWVLEWPHDHLRQCSVGGLQSDAKMQALRTRIHRPIRELNVEGGGRLPDYTEPEAVQEKTRGPAGRTHAECA